VAQPGERFEFFALLTAGRIVLMLPSVGPFVSVAPGFYVVDFYRKPGDFIKCLSTFPPDRVV